MQEQHIISDLTVAEPRNALSTTPARDHWLVVPYEGAEVSGNMLWSPVRNNPPDVSVKLPELGRCEIYVGIYASGTWPWWFNLIGNYGGVKTYNRLRLRLSDEDWFDLIIPEDYPDTPRFTYISETLWKTADVTGKSLVLAPERHESMADTTISVAYIRLVPSPTSRPRRKPSKEIASYFDCMFHGHYVNSVADVKRYLEPLRDADFSTIFWNASREDTCYYPTKIGNPLPADTPPGVYPYWSGSDMRRMLEAGHDPLRTVCEVGHDCGLKVFSSYRRMTCRMPPFVFPIHPDALFVKHPELRCTDREGKMVPHLSMTFPEVRQRMISLLLEQAENYDIDGVHLFFARGVPFVYFESPFVDEFRRRYDTDPRELADDDERIWGVRAHFVLQLLKELRAALDQAGEKKGRRLEVALHTVNSLRNCAYYGMDIRAIVEQRLADIIIPSQCAFLPDALGEPTCTAEFLGEFVTIAAGTGIRIWPELKRKRGEAPSILAERAKGLYSAGVEGLVTHTMPVARYEWHLLSRLGHADELDHFLHEAEATARPVYVDSVGGLPFDLQTGIPTCG